MAALNHYDIHLPRSIKSTVPPTVSFVYFFVGGAPIWERKMEHNCEEFVALGTGVNGMHAIRFHKASGSLIPKLT